MLPTPRITPGRGVMSASLPRPITVRAFSTAPLSSTTLTEASLPTWVTVTTGGAMKGSAWALTKFAPAAPAEATPEAAVPPLCRSQKGLESAGSPELYAPALKFGRSTAPAAQEVQAQQLPTA